MSNTNIIISLIVVLALVVGGMMLFGGGANDSTSQGDTATKIQPAPQKTMEKEMKEDDTAMLAEKMEKAVKTNTIVDKAVELEMTTLVEAVQAAGLVETLSGDGPFTVFVPTQQAFDAIGPTLEQIMAAPDAKEQLANILTYHVVAGEVSAADVVELTKATTVQGSDVKITVNGETVKVNDATVVQTDVEVDNGIIHVIDAVLIPNSN